MTISPTKVPSQDITSRILQRLVNGSRWLTEQHRLWLNGDTAADDSAFYLALVGWETLEAQLRGQDFQGCIFGQNNHCPQAAVVDCRACVASNDTMESLERQLGFSE